MKTRKADGGMVDSLPEEAIKNTVRDPAAARLLDLDLAKYALMNQPQRMAQGGQALPEAIGGQLPTPIRGHMGDMSFEQYRASIGMHEGGRHTGMANGGQVKGFDDGGRVSLDQMRHDLMLKAPKRDEVEEFNQFEAAGAPTRAKPLDMEGRATFLPFKDNLPGSVMNTREWAVPGILAEAYNAFTAPARSVTQLGFDAPKEALNMGMNVMGGGMGLSRAAPAPEGSLGMAVKSKGGNWVAGNGSPETLVERLKLSGQVEPGLARELGLPEEFPQISNWVEKRLTPYIKNEMGTPGDPVRLQADKGILHYTPEDLSPMALGRTEMKRKEFGSPTEGLSMFTENGLGRLWENISDYAITPRRVEGLLTSERQPWMSKLDPSDKINSVEGVSATRLGFDHLKDELRNAVAKDESLPKSLHIDPAKVEKMSVPEVVAHVAKINEHRMAARKQADLEAQKDMVVTKAYDDGHRWVQLTKPGQFAMESDAMGHSVRGYEPPKGHADWAATSKNSGSSSYGHGGWDAIKSGEAGVYSLRDPNGASLITVETGPTKLDRAIGSLPAAEKEFLRTESAKRAGIDIMSTQLYDKDWDKLMTAMDEVYIEKYGSPPPYISQIKGPGNSTIKDEGSRRLIIDFLNSGKFDEVKDLHANGIIDTVKDINYGPESTLEPIVPNMPRFIAKEDTYNYFRQKPPPGRSYADGGHVQRFEDGGEASLDQMRYELDRTNSPVMQATPRSTANRVTSTIGGYLDEAGRFISNALEPISKTHPIRSSLVNMFVADSLKNAGTALQDYTGTVRETDEDNPVVRSPITGRGQTLKLDPRVLDIAGVAQPIVSGATKLAGAGVKAVKPFAKSAAEMANEMYMSGEMPGMIAPASYAIKNKGGNWNPDSVDEFLNKMKLGDTGFWPGDKESNAWVDKRMRDYVQKEMGTPDDPVRKLADEGIFHQNADDFWWAGDSRNLSTSSRRETEGFPREGVATTNLGKAWEQATDSMISPRNVYNYYDKDPKPWMEWMKNADPNTKVNSIKGVAEPYQFGFDHLMDELRLAAAGDDSLPKILHIDPAKLGKMSVPEAVKHVAKINEHRANAIAQASLEAQKDMVVYKNYDNGDRWVQLTKPGEFAMESDAMGHSVRGYEPPKDHEDWSKLSGNAGSLGYGFGGWDGIKSGRVKVYSLRDEKGKSLVTIEAGKDKSADLAVASMPIEKREKIIEEVERRTGITDAQTKPEHHLLFSKVLNEVYKEMYGEPPLYINQIRTASNGSIKDKEFKGRVIDFLNSGDFGRIKDLHTMGIIDTHTDRGMFGRNASYEPISPDIPRFIDSGDLDKYFRPKKADGGQVQSLPGYARGGKIKKVSFAKSADEMRKELLGTK